MDNNITSCEVVWEDIAGAIIITNNGIAYEVPIEAYFYDADLHCYFVYIQYLTDTYKSG